MFRNFPGMLFWERKAFSGYFGVRGCCGSSVGSCDTVLLRHTEVGEVGIAGK